MRLNVNLDESHEGFVRGMPHGWLSQVIRHTLHELHRVRVSDPELFLSVLDGNNGWEIKRKGG